MRHFCAGCVDAIEGHHVSRRSRWGDAAVLMVVGSVVLAMSLLADALQFGNSKGFGWIQLQGVLIGLGLVLLGAIARARTLLMIGMIAMLLSLLADWLQLGDAEGFGIHQLSGSAFGVAVIGLGVWMARKGA